MAVVALACCLPSVLLVGCSRTSAPKTPELKVSYIENASCWPLFVALDKGLFDKAGVKVKAVKAANSTEAINAMLAGQVDGSIENTYSALFAVEANSPGTIRLFLPCSETKQRYVSHLLLPPNSKITKLEQLKGKKLGTYSGATQLLTLKLFVSRHMHLDPEKDVKIVQVDPSMQVQALASGQFDALFTVEPFATTAIVKAGAKDFVPYARGAILDPFPAGACSVRAQVAGEKREAVRRVYEALARAADFIGRNDREARQILAKHTKLDAVAAAKVGGYTYYQVEDFSAADRTQVQRLADMYADAKILPKRVNAAGMFVSAQDLR